VVADPDSRSTRTSIVRMTHPDGSSQVRGHDDLSKMVWREVVLPLIRVHEAKQQASEPATIQCERRMPLGIERR
jgi:hypothetical protein